MPRTLQKSVKFGASHTGLTTVGYKLVGALGNVVQARTTSGVSEIGGGEYGAYITFPDGFEGIIYWDSFDGSSLIASEEYNQDIFPDPVSVDAEVIAAAAATLAVTQVLAELAAQGTSATGSVQTTPGALKRKDVRARISTRIPLKWRTLLGDDPDTLDEIIDAIADEICRETRCFWREMTTALQDGRATYCIPEQPGGVEMFEIVSTRILDANGAPRPPLTQSNVLWLDQHYPTWRDATPTGLPVMFAWHMPSLTLIPAPDYDKTAGLIFEGYCTPGRSWGDDESDCPLPSRCIETLVNGCCARWLSPIAYEKESVASMNNFERIYEAGKARLKIDVAWQMELGRAAA